MLTAADEFLTHQTPYTFDHVFTSDRNFYDRYFFNGYRRDGGVYFGVAMGMYPNLGVMDAAFSVTYQGKQRVVRASRAIGNDRMDSAAGPISVEVLEPLKRLRVRVGKNDWGIEADLVFEARSLPVEEPHFRRESRGVTAMDYTRMTQHGSWGGTLTLDGQAFDLSQDAWWGSRDHSWGIRGVGGRDPRGAPVTEAPQFFWNWAPVNFDDLCTLYTVSELPNGERWHESGVILTPYPNATAEEVGVDHDLAFTKGTRHIASATVTLRPKDGEPLSLEFKPLYHFLMKGLGYGEPKWGHGMWVGPNEVDGTEYDLATEDPMTNLHVQTVCLVTARVPSSEARGPSGKQSTEQREGIGVFEHIVIGPHERYGFKGTMDVAG